MSVSTLSTIALVKGIDETERVRFGCSVLHRWAERELGELLDLNVRPAGVLQMPMLTTSEAQSLLDDLGFAAEQPK
jgi:hypothetical protein